MSTPTPHCFTQYKPSLIAAIAVTVFFAATTSIHIAQVIRYRTFYFIPFALAGVCEIVGYISRSVVAAEYPGCSTVPYVLNTVLPLMAPAPLASSMYPILGHIIHETGGERLALVRGSWRTKILLLGDILSGVIQVTGGVMLTRANGAKAGMERGEHFISVGLMIQLGFFCLFLVLAIHYNFRLHNNLTDASWYVDWRTYFGILFFAGGLIVIRTTFRLVEYVQGDEGELRSSEVYLYLFDAALILPVMAIFNFKHPSSLVVKGERLRPENEDAIESNTYLLQERGTK